jgi:fibronectin type 3 domain-containing protein
MINLPPKKLQSSPKESLMRPTLAVVCLVVSMAIQMFAQNPQPALLASLRPQPRLMLQRVSPTVENPSGPVLYQILFRSSATPGNIPVISPQFTLMNSHISDSGSIINFSVPVTFANGQNFPGTLPLTGGTMLGNITFAGGQSFPGTISTVTAGTGITTSTVNGNATVGIANGGVGLAQINSAAVASGSVLTADGNGGVIWESAPGVTTVVGRTITAGGTIAGGGFSDIPGLSDITFNSSGRPLIFMAHMVGAPGQSYQITLDGNPVDSLDETSSNSYTLSWTDLLPQVSAGVHTLALQIKADRSFTFTQASFAVVETTGPISTPSGTPGIPQNLVAVGGPAQIQLSWSASSGATSYSVQRSEGGPFHPLGTTATTAVVDTNVTPGSTYYYVVSAMNGAGTSANSNQASATPQNAAPSGLTATAGYQQITLSWMGVTGATGYNIKRGTTSGGPYTTIAASTQPSFQDASVVNGTTYYYVVTASQGVESAPSNQATALARITAVTQLYARAQNGKALLSWNGVANESFTVKRSLVNGGPYTTIANVTTTSFTDVGLTNGTTYYYVVTAVTPTGESAPSNQAFAVPFGPPAAPTGLSLRQLPNGFTISWNAVSGAYSYNLYSSSTSGGPYSLLTTTTHTFAQDCSLGKPGLAAFYVVTANGDAGASSNSTEVSGITSALAAPTLTVTGTGDQYVSLSWTPLTSAPGNSYFIYLSSNGPSNFQVIGNATPNTTMTVQNLSNGIAYLFKLSSMDACGVLAPDSNVVTATPEGPVFPTAPAGVAASAGSHQVTLNWQAVATATGYEVRRSTVSGGPYTSVGSASSLSLIDGGLTPGVTYFYVVVAMNSLGVSGNSGEVSAVPTP